MTVSFDTLSCAKRLSEAGEKPEVAEAHALMLKDFATTTLPGKADIRHLCEEIENARDDIQDLRCEIKDFRQEVTERLATKAELGHELSRLRNDIDAMGQRLTVRMIGMLVLA